MSRTLGAEWEALEGRASFTSAEEARGLEPSFVIVLLRRSLIWLGRELDTTLGPRPCGVPTHCVSVPVGQWHSAVFASHCCTHFGQVMSSIVLSKRLWWCVLKMMSLLWAWFLCSGKMCFVASGTRQQRRKKDSSACSVCRFYYLGFLHQLFFIIFLKNIYYKIILYNKRKTNKLKKGGKCIRTWGSLEKKMEFNLLQKCCCTMAKHDLWPPQRGVFFLLD